jgi:methionyl-tRNA formyltransferase
VNSFYRKIIVIGNGSLMTNCVKHIQKFSTAEIECIEYPKQNFSNLKIVCNSGGIAYRTFDRRVALKDFFLAINKNALVLSIHNSYIFPEQVLLNKNLRIINFHNSLLPGHPGRNAPTWAIYDMDKESGITWHEVIPEIDKGDIIQQKSIAIGPYITGMDLTRQCVNLGLETFKDIFPGLLKNDYCVTPQAPEMEVRMHYSHEIPNNGVLNRDWDIQKISAFLRSVDYGVYPIFEKPKICFHDKWFEVEKYKILQPPFMTTTKGNSEEVYFWGEELSVKINIKPI